MYTDAGTTPCHNAGSSDVEPPSVPEGLSVVAVGATSVDLAWAASVDDVGVSRYRVFRDGSVVGEVAAPARSLRDVGLVSGASYRYEVSAVDGAGNESPRSAAVLVTPGSGSVLSFVPTDDTYVRQASPDALGGKASRLVADADPVTDLLVRFAVAGTAGCRVTDARLRLTVGTNASEARCGAETCDGWVRGGAR